MPVSSSADNLRRVDSGSVSEGCSPARNDPSTTQYDCANGTLSFFSIIFWLNGSNGFVEVIYRGSIPRHIMVNFVRPRANAAFDTLQVFETLLAQEVQRLH